jgi:hypothetical protein
LTGHFRRSGAKIVKILVIWNNDQILLVTNFGTGVLQSRRSRRSRARDVTTQHLRKIERGLLALQCHCLNPRGGLRFPI